MTTDRARAAALGQRRRPAEKAAATSGAAAILAAALGADTTQLAILAGLTGLLPAVVTGLRTSGGLRGVLLVLWRGRS